MAKRFSHLSILDSLPAASIILNRAGQIEYANPIAVELIGAETAAQLKQNHLDELITPKDGGSFDQMLAEMLDTGERKTVPVELHRLDGIDVSIQLDGGPLEEEGKFLFLMTRLPQVGLETDELHRAYIRQKTMNKRLAEILELGRTFSLYTDLNKVTDRIVRVVGESLGFGFTGLYLKEPNADRMRVATYINNKLNYESFKQSNPGNDWDILMTVTRNPNDLVKIGGIRIPVKFGADSFGAGDDQHSDPAASISGSIWKVDGAFLAMVQLNGAVTGGYLRVSHPISEPCREFPENESPNADVFCPQALWIFANQAAIAIENAHLIERARNDLEKRAMAERDLTATQGALENRIRERTHELEKLNTELRSEIKDREVAQRELDQQTRFLRQVLDINPTLIYARDRKGRYTLINEAAARFEGLTVDDVMGKTDNELHHEISQILRWRHEDLNVMDNKQELFLPVERITDTHGTEHFMQSIKRPIFGPDGNVDQVLGVSIEISARIKAEQRAVQANVELAQAYDATIEGWSKALDLRDKETEGHSLRVTLMTLRLAQQIGIEPSEFLHLRRGALLHDIGKMGIPDEILFKKGSLNANEWVIMRKHPTYAYEMLKEIDYLRPALVIPRYHHEKWDGTGYPEMLAGELIPMAARIFAIVDVWDALTSDRPYRSAWDPGDVLDHIIKNSGTHFDPKVVEVFTQNLDEIVSNTESE